MSQYAKITSGIDRTEKPDGVKYTEVASITEYVRKTNSSGYVTHRFRIEITSFNGVDDCSAEILIWMSGGWKFVHRLAARDITTPDGLREIYDSPKDEVLEDTFYEDRDELIRIAASICF